jgi:hypothetical protein
MRVMTTTLILLAGLAAGCATPSYYGPGPSTSYYAAPGSTTTYVYTPPAGTTYVYTPSDRAACESAGGRWHMLSGTCTIPR